MDTRESLELELRAAVAARVGGSRYGLWFGDDVRLGVDGDALVVGVPNSFFRDWIDAHFAHSLAEAAQAVLGRPLAVAVRVDAEAEPPAGDVVRAPVPDPLRRGGTTVPIPGHGPGPIHPGPMPAAPLPGGGERERGRPAGRPQRRLDDFVVGPGSRLAHAAAVELVQSAGAGFNPLVIHGGIGLGKTHLLEGIAAALRARYPSWNVLQVTAEAFTNAFLQAMRVGALPEFRNRFRKADALVLDDVHFLAAKRATQDEFLHTFNALVSAGAPVILSADQHPRRIGRLTEELATRFLGGMVVRLELPDPATRRAILKAKAVARGVDVPEGVLAYIAEHLRSSVRELEGALHSVLAHAVLTGRRVDLDLARTALRDTIRHTAQAVALRDVERAVCGLFGVEPEGLRSDSRARTLLMPRMLAMYLARKHTGASYSEIGRHFGGRNHSTVIAAEKRVAIWLREEQRNGLLAGFESVGDLLASLEGTLATA
jgi:chromosomal replication initiator protein